MDMMVINEKFYASLTRVLIHHYSCLPVLDILDFRQKIAFWFREQFFWLEATDLSVLLFQYCLFFAFDFLFFRVINEEITSSVLLCKPIYQRHFYSNDFKNKPFPFFGISRGYFEKFIWHIYLHKQKQIACIFQYENEPYYLTRSYLLPEMAVAILTMITFRLVGSQIFRVDAGLR